MTPKELSEQLMARINAHRKELPLPLRLMAQKWLDRQQLTPRERRVCQAVLAYTLGCDRPLAGIPATQITEAMGQMPEGAASKQSTFNVTWKLVQRGVLGCIWGDKKRAHIWWGAWLQEIIEAVEDDEAWDLLAEARRLASESEIIRQARRAAHKNNPANRSPDNPANASPIIRQEFSDNPAAPYGVHYKAHLQSSLVKAHVGLPAQPDRLPVITDLVETATGAWEAAPVVPETKCRWCYGRGCSECPDRVAARFKPLGVGP